MTDSITAQDINDRSAGYFMEQQTGLHGTVVSIALGVAGLAAASLFDVGRADRPDHILFWALWVTSLLGVAIVYSGMTVNVFAAPEHHTQRVGHVPSFRPSINGIHALRSSDLAFDKAAVATVSYCGLVRQPLSVRRLFIDPH